MLKRNVNNLSLEDKGKLCKKIHYYLVWNANKVPTRGRREEKSVIKGCYHFTAPFHPTDNDIGYTLNGYAIGVDATNDLLKQGVIKKLTKKQAMEYLLSQV